MISIEDVAKSYWELLVNYLTEKYDWVDDQFVVLLVENEQ